MDPDANLKEQLELANKILEGDSENWASDNAERLAELVISLNEWLTHDGFKPRAWEKK
jgi:hypothetical protein